jgi:hypothetical protein
VTASDGDQEARLLAVIHVARRFNPGEQLTLRTSDCIFVALFLEALPRCFAPEIVSSGIVPWVHTAGRLSKPGLGSGTCAGRPIRQEESQDEK